jgi:hypothetical protein
MPGSCRIPRYTRYPNPFWDAAADARVAAQIRQETLNRRSTMQINVHLLMYSPEDRTLVGEASDLGLQQWPREITVGGDAGDTKTFTLWKADLDASGEQIAGYRYRSLDGQVLLIIND